MKKLAVVGMMILGSLSSFASNSLIGKWCLVGNSNDYKQEITFTKSGEIIGLIIENNDELDPSLGIYTINNQTVTIQFYSEEGLEDSISSDFKIEKNGSLSLGNNEGIHFIYKQCK